VPPAAASTRAAPSSSTAAASSARCLAPWGRDTRPPAISIERYVTSRAMRRPAW
jgi:hypothetical protein